ncbi:MAG: DUF2252 family protein [Crocosphaera sp.]|nr:DUF2252 family protein [Crocosphaera sp.]
MTTTKEIQNTVTTKQRVGIINPLQADRSANTWHKISFNPPFPDNNQVIVLPMTQTYQGNETPGLRIRNVNPQGFEIRFDEVITSTGNSSDGHHINEQVGWLAYGIAAPGLAVNKEVQQRSEFVCGELEKYNNNISPENKRLKYGKMACSAFRFYRGTNHLYWSDFTNDPRLQQFGNEKTKTWIQGDLHAFNFGSFDNDNDVVVYDLNDFDESLVADYQYDVWRMAISLVIIARETHKFSSPEQEQVIEAFAQYYLETLAKCAEDKQAKKAEFSKKNTYAALDDFLEEVEEENSRKEMLDKWTELVANQRIFKLSSEKLGEVSEGQKRIIRQALSGYYASLPEKLASQSDKFKVKDIAERLLAGTGSLGTPRYYMLLEDHKGIERILDIKRQSKPTAYQYFNNEQKEQYNQWFGESEGQRHATAYRALIKNTDDFLGVLELADGSNPGSYSVRQRSPYKESFDTSSLKRKSSFVKIAQQWGIILATAHARADKDFSPMYVPYFFAKQVTKQTENSQEAFQLLVKEIAFDYAQQVETDWQSFLNHFDVEPLFCD